jgi:glutathione S-transferase
MPRAKRGFKARRRRNRPVDRHAVKAHQRHTEAATPDPQQHRQEPHHRRHHCPAQPDGHLRAKSPVVPPERKGMVGYGSYDEAVAALEARLTDSPYIAGDRFTAADVYVGSQVGWGMMFKTMPVRPAFVAYWDRLKDRPARQRAVAKDS